MNTYALTITRRKDRYTETYLIQAEQCPTEAWLIKYPKSNLLKEVPNLALSYLMPAAQSINKVMAEIQPGDWPHCAWCINHEYDCLITAFCPAKEEIIEPKDYWREENKCR